MEFAVVDDSQRKLGLPVPGPDLTIYSHVVLTDNDNLSTRTFLTRSMANNVEEVNDFLEEALSGVENIFACDHYRNKVGGRISGISYITRKNIDSFPEEVSDAHKEADRIAKETTKKARHKIIRLLANIQRPVSPEEWHELLNDKYSAREIVVDCGDTINRSCGTECCRRDIPLNLQDLVEGIIPKPDNSFLIAKKGDYCAYLSQKTGQCSIWNKRPKACREYVCPDKFSSNLI